MAWMSLFVEGLRLFLFFFWGGLLYRETTLKTPACSWGVSPCLGGFNGGF